jgi:hypothetical protein
LGYDGKAFQRKGASMCNSQLLLAGLLSAAFASPALAGGSDATALRCGTDLLKLGESKVAAVQKCGEPLAADSFCQAQPPQVVGPRGAPVLVNVPCETVEEWTYNPGYGQFMTTLRFASGRLVAITYGERSR